MMRAGRLWAAAGPGLCLRGLFDRVSPHGEAEVFSRPKAPGKAYPDLKGGAALPHLLSAPLIERFRQALCLPLPVALVISLVRR